MAKGVSRKEEGEERAGREILTVLFIFDVPLVFLARVFAYEGKPGTIVGTGRKGTGMYRKGGMGEGEED